MGTLLVARRTRSNLTVGAAHCSLAQRLHVLLLAQVGTQLATACVFLLWVFVLIRGEKVGVDKKFRWHPSPSRPSHGLIKLAKIPRAIGEILAIFFNNLRTRKQSDHCTGGEVGNISVGSVNSFLHRSGFAKFFYGFGEFLPRFYKFLRAAIHQYVLQAAISGGYQQCLTMCY